MGLVNTVVPLAELEATTIQWCREILELSPTALRFLKSAMNADCDGQIGPPGPRRLGHAPLLSDRRGARG